MPLRTPEQYRASLRDGRCVYFQGKRVDDVTAHPVIGVAVQHASLDYEMAERPEHRELAVCVGPNGPMSRFFHVPMGPVDLLKRSELIEASTALGATLVVLVKEIGSDALLSLRVVAAQVDRALGTAYLPRVLDFYAHCRDNDLAMSVAQTDVKGDRSLNPADQEDPDLYLRVVARDERGIVVRGAKVHTSCAPNVNEIIVLPTRAMREADADYAVSFAVPADTPGLKLIASPYGPPAASAFERPISARHKMMETLTVFDDVFVPWERVFLCGEWRFAGPLALQFVKFHRFTAVSYKLPLVDLLVGAGQLVAEFNGIERAGHVREKLVRLIAYAETLRALTRQAALECTYDEGVAVPNPLITNMAKYHFAHYYHEAVRDLQDLAGGSLVTGPGIGDLESPETGPYVHRYYAGRKGTSGEERLRVLNLISDLTASDFGGYQEVLAVHAEGSLEAEKLAVLREYAGQRTRDYARRLAGLE